MLTIFVPVSLHLSDDPGVFGIGEYLEERSVFRAETHTFSEGVDLSRPGMKMHAVLSKVIGRSRCAFVTLKPVYVT